jgi:hypothetical protein
MASFMNLFKRKKKKTEESLKYVSLKDSLGNEYSVRDTGAGLVDESTLTGETQAQLSIAQKGLGTLLQEMALTQSQRQEGVSNRQKELYDPLASDINRSMNEASGQLRSREAKRFGGALNSTFSAIALGSLNETRLRALESAYLGSFTNALKELTDADASRSVRFNALAGFLDDSETRKQRYTLAGFNAIQQSKFSRQQALQNLNNSLSKAKSKGSGDVSQQDIEAIAKAIASSGG